MPFLLFGVACLAVLAGSVVREVMASDLAPGPRAMVALIVVLLLATSFNGIDCSAPQLGVYLHTCAFLVLALVLLDGKDEAGRHATARRFGALAAGAGAAFGVDGGLLAWPVLIWAAWRGGLGLRWIVLIGLVGALVIAAYLHGWSENGNTLNLISVTPLRMADYVIRFLGLPWSHSLNLVNFGRAVGAATLGFGSYAILRFGLLQAPRSRLDRIAIGMLLFSFMTAAVITVGRLNAAPDREMPIRYALFTSLAQVALLLVVAPSLARLWATGWRRLGQAVVLLGAVLFLGQQILAGRAGAEGAAQYTAAYRTLEAGKWSRDREDLVGNSVNVQQVLNFAHAHGLYRAGP
jgi:hypothetical protein